MLSKEQETKSLSRRNFIGLGLALCGDFLIPACVSREPPVLEQEKVTLPLDLTMQHLMATRTVQGTSTPAKEGDRFFESLEAMQAATIELELVKVSGSPEGIQVISKPTASFIQTEKGIFLLITLHGLRERTKEPLTGDGRSNLGFN